MIISVFLNGFSIHSKTAFLFYMGLKPAYSPAPHKSIPLPPDPLSGKEKRDACASLFISVNNYTVITFAELFIFSSISYILLTVPALSSSVMP